MLFSEDINLNEQELGELKRSAIDYFKLGIRRINNGEDPKQVGEIEFAIKEFKDYQGLANLSNKEMLNMLESNKISISSPEVNLAIEKSFIGAFNSALEVCEWYKDIMEIDVTDAILEGVKNEFISNLKWGHYNYKEMIRLGEFSEEFLTSKEVREAAEKELLRMIERGEFEEIDDFIEIFDLGDFLNSIEVEKSAKEKFVDLVKENKYEEALQVKEKFNLNNCKDLLKELNEFYDRLSS